MSTEISSYDAFWGCAGGLRVASTFRLPHLLHRSRFTKPTIGVPGVIARRNLSSGWRHSVRLSQRQKVASLPIFRERLRSAAAN